MNEFSLGQILAAVQLLERQLENARKSPQELFWQARQFLSEMRQAEDDERRLRHLKTFGTVSEEEGARLATRDKNPKDARRRKEEMMDFLLAPAEELLPPELELRELWKNQDGGELAGLLRLYKPGIHYQQFYAFLGERINPKWTPIKGPIVRRRKKYLKKVLAEQSLHSGNGNHQSRKEISPSRRRVSKKVAESGK